MEFSTKSGSPENIVTDCIAVGVFASGGKSPPVLAASGKALDAAIGGYLSALFEEGDFSAKAGNVLMLYKIPGLAAKRVLLFGLGKEKEAGPASFATAVRAAVSAIAASGAHKAVLALDVNKKEVAAHLRQATLVAAMALTAKAEKRHKKESGKEKKSSPLGALTFLLAPETLRGKEKEAASALEEGEAIASGMALARRLGNLPANECTPEYLADTARELAKTHAMTAEVLDEKAMHDLGMKALLAVARGARTPPRFIVLQYKGKNKGGKKTAGPLVLVGKGITFDSGGISLKPAASMDEMKYDMCGAAAVLGVMSAAARLALPLHLVALLPACENMPGGNATRPGDVVRTLSGQTVEILNTDAEGRLILADALAYAKKFAPAAIIDIATLTGACVVALGRHPHGLFANDDALAGALLAAGEAAQDRAWRLPLWDDYQEALESNFADLANVGGGRDGGAITAACFLSRFIDKKTPWAHLDIAGTAWKTGKEKGATGRPVALLCHYLLALSAG
ncbi:MAG: leucyl aminopeptidase [Zoogloeaceae bacterium]|nr:leucyl aminopeptidase [Zoogloeaceae bacterium]